jgi:hypothetical protein
MAAKTRPTRIQLKGHGVWEEAKAAAAIRPGDLVNLNTAGEVRKHPTAGGPASASFALEDALQGKSIADSYATGDRVTYATHAPGDVVLAYLAGGENASIGSYLTSKGTGALKVSSGTDVRVAEALEAVNASDSNDVDERIRVRIL